MTPSRRHFIRCGVVAERWRPQQVIQKKMVIALQVMEPEKAGMMIVMTYRYYERY